MLTTDEFFGLVQKHLAEREPFAMCRVSDGEVMLLNRHAYYSEYIKIVSRLWGYAPKEDELKELSVYLVKAILHSDVLGFPTARHLARADYFRDAETVFEKFVPESLSNYDLVSVDIAWEMLAGSKLSDSNTLIPDYFEELLRDAHSLYYVSCWNLDEQFKKRYGVRNVSSYQTPPEPKFTSGYSGEKHYPYHFNKIKEWISTLDCTGSLCLVGAGVFSKMYNIWFKEQGGVSLDIGSVFDGFKGRSTRGKTRGLDVEDLTYKL